MTMVTPASRTSSRTERRARRLTQAAAGAVGATQPVRPHEPPVAVETLRARWAAALASAQSALRAAGGALRPDDLREHSRHLALERDATAVLLQAYAHDERSSPQYLHLAVAPWEARRLLGLPDGIDACIFNLDGVLIGSAALHVAAWTETFDELITHRIERTHGRFAPFNPQTDYADHVRGRPRLEGVRAFLATRGIRLAEGEAGDAPGAETVWGLANRKNEALLRRLNEQGVTAFEDSRRYLETARDARIHRAVVSASAHTPALLERAGLGDLVEACVDGNVIVAERLAARPAPDILLAACNRVGVAPGHAAAFETSPAGVEAARAGGFALVVGVDHTGEPGALREAGADRIVSGLTDLLDHALAA